MLLRLLHKDMLLTIRRLLVVLKTAMLAAAGFMAQELVNGKGILENLN